GISKVSAIITDNASVMKKAWHLLGVDYPEILFLGCVAHSLNLLVDDIIKLLWSANIFKKAKATTRWGSLATCLNSFLQNQLALKLTITELAHDNHIVLPNTIRNTINNENFWEDVESLLTILDKL
ncbi:12088_t:CDS:2, partial [Gigaspora rosea]